MRADSRGEGFFFIQRHTWNSSAPARTHRDGSETASPQLRSSGDSLLNSRIKTRMDTRDVLYDGFWLFGPSVSRKLNLTSPKCSEPAYSVGYQADSNVSRAAVTVSSVSSEPLSVDSVYTERAESVSVSCSRAREQLHSYLCNVPKEESALCTDQTNIFSRRACVRRSDGVFSR